MQLSVETKTKNEYYVYTLKLREEPSSLKRETIRQNELWRVGVLVR